MTPIIMPDYLTQVQKDKWIDLLLDPATEQYVGSGYGPINGHLSEYTGPTYPIGVLKRDVLGHNLETDLFDMILMDNIGFSQVAIMHDRQKKTFPEIARWIKDNVLTKD